MKSDLRRTTTLGRTSERKLERAEWMQRRLQESSVEKLQACQSWGACSCMSQR